MDDAERAEPPSKKAPNTLVWFSPDEMLNLAERGRALAENPEGIQKVIAERWMEDSEILHAAFRRFMEQVGSAPDLESALKLAVVAVKIHDAKQEMTRPMVRRIMEGFRGKGKLAGTRAHKQIPGHSGSSSRSGRPGRGREGQPGLGSDASEGGCPSVVDVRPYGLVAPDGDRPGDEGADSQDPGSEGQPADG